MFTDKFDKLYVDSLYNSVKELYITYRDQYDSCLKKRDELLSNVNELNKYVDSISSQKNKDSLVFSPRGVVDKGIYAIDKNLSNSVIDENYIIKKQDELKDLNNIFTKQEDELQSLLSLVNIFEENMNVLYTLKDLLNSSKDIDIRNLYFTFHSGNKFIISYLKNDILDELTYLLHQKKMIDSFIEQDVVRAKQEFSFMENSIESLITKIENLEFVLQPYPLEFTFKKDLEILDLQIHKLFPECNLQINVLNTINICNYLNRILLISFLKELFFEVFSNKINDSIVMDIDFTDGNICFLLKSESDVFARFNDKDDKFSIISSIIEIIDANYIIECKTKIYYLSFKMCAN